MCAVSACLGPSLAQMSPGELSKAHQALDTPLRCGACHEFGARRAQFRCLECHGEIQRRLEEKRGYHARVVKGSGREASNDCARCHSEHNGRNHRLVRWPRPQAQFDHREAGWALEGKHARLDCRQCHQESRITAEDRGVLRRANPGQSFAGLNGKCASCHRDEHRGDLGQDCRRCHSAEAWKPAPGFWHDASRYPLTGRHRSVECSRCHKPILALGSHVQYRNFVQFETCRSCHADAHGGAFAGGCDQCHTTEGWKGARVAGRFDHGRTAFPLRGRHAAVDCRKCHRSENFRTPVAHGRCLDCHQDRHGGQFAHRAGGECAPCHSETGWKPARFGREEHGSTKFPLKGGHAAVECAKCHATGNGRVDYHPGFESCRNCHRDEHGGQFAALPHQNRCERCHQDAGWHVIRYTVRDHQSCRFPLSGAHAAVACAECHKGSGAGRVFRFAGIACASCHQDPHRTLENIAAGARLSAASEQWGCESCHTPRAWNETAEFDHGRTRFALAGRHKGTPCKGCHKPSLLGARRMLAFRGTPQDCAACHADPHLGQFSAGEGKPGGCGACHTASSWMPTGFDHQRHSTFPLTGAHVDVPCRLCHPATESGGRHFVQYRGTPRACQECHR